MIATTIDCTVGIYNTQATVRVYADKTIVTAPYVKWASNTGTLSFRKVRFAGAQDAYTAYVAAVNGVSIADAANVVAQMQ
jgi:hypothetical protein